MARGPCSSLLIVLDTKAPGIDRVARDFAASLGRAGFTIAATEEQLARLQRCISSFHMPQGTRDFPTFDLRHPKFAERINFFCHHAEDDLTGPEGTITFNIVFAQTEVLASPTMLTKATESVIVPLIMELAHQLPVFLIELDEELTWMTAWQALNRGSGPLSKLLCLSPAALQHPGARMCRSWGEAEALPNGGLLIRPYLHSWVGLRNCLYPAPEAQVVWTPTEEGLLTEIYSFEPLTASQRLFATQGGVTVNGINWPGVRRLEELAGQRQEIPAASLYDSMFWHQGELLAIQKFAIQWGPMESGKCRVTIDAVVEGAVADEAVKAHAVLLAAALRGEGP